MRTEKPLKSCLAVLLAEIILIYILEAEPLNRYLVPRRGALEGGGLIVGWVGGACSWVAGVG